MIVILSGPGDVHADAVEAALAARGAGYLRFDATRYPDEAACSFTVQPDGAVTGSILAGSTVVPLESVTAVWVRRPGRPASVAAHLGPVARQQIAADSAAVLDDLWGLLPALCVPGPPDRIASAAYKARQLRRAAELGFEIPLTWTGNDPDSLLNVVADGPGGFVTKRAAASQRLADEAGTDLIRYTQVLRPSDLVHVDGVALCPIVVQAAVPKRLELRVTVVGDRVFAAAIYSQRSNHTRHDWRRYDLANTPVEPYDLDPATAARCVELVDGYGLGYGAIDLIVTPDGRTVFLELNPNGQYLWIEGATGQPISAALADLLIAAPVAARTPVSAGGPDAWFPTSGER